MARFLLHCVLAIFTVVTFCATTSAESRKDESEASAPRTDMKKERAMDYDLMVVLKNCNETYQIEMSYLVALNESGSFPDETNRKAKCYLKCVLETLDIASPEGNFNPELTAMAFAGQRNGTPMDGITEMATLCAERNETCKCDRSYNYIKCLIEKYQKQS